MFFLLTALYARNSPYSCIFVFLALNLACDEKNPADFCNFSRLKVLFRLDNPGRLANWQPQNRMAQEKEKGNSMKMKKRV